jgi:hypothetical protein
MGGAEARDYATAACLVTTRDSAIFSFAHFAYEARTVLGQIQSLVLVELGCNGGVRRGCQKVTVTQVLRRL